MALFADGFYPQVFGAGVWGEPTALDGGDRIDIWCTGSTSDYLCYSYCTNGTTFATPVATDLPAGRLRPHILKVGSAYYVYLTTVSGLDLTCYTSADKLNWTLVGTALSRGADGILGNPFVWVEGLTWHMLYEAYWNIGGMWSIGYASGTGPTTFTKYDSNPVLTGGGAGCGGGVGNPELPRSGSTIIKRGSQYVMYYHGQTPGQLGALGRANSTDLVHWTVEGNADGAFLQDGYTPWNGTSGWSWGDHCLCEWQGKTYLWWSQSNQVDTAWVNMAVDNRTLAELLMLYPYNPGDINPAWMAELQ